MNTTVADDRPVEPMTAPPVHSITATTDPNNSLSDISRDENSGHKAGGSRPKVAANGVNPDSLHSCDIESCGRVFVFQRELDVHRKTVHKVGAHEAYQCERCGLWLILSAGQLEAHNLKCRPKTSGKRPNDGQQQQHWCPDCCKLFDTALLLHHHVIANHPSRLADNWCDNCGQGFTNGDDLHRHRIAVHLPKDMPYLCESCGKAFGTDEGLREHQRVVHNPSLVCESCGRTFRSANAFHGHRKAVHDVPFPAPNTGPKRPTLPKQPCDTCGRLFVNSQALTQHKRDKMH
ncbi:unnamed protein product, partial [Medioppia subpectinata]